MSFAEVLQELPALTIEQRQLLIRRAIEIDEPAMTLEEESLVDGRLAALREQPESSVTLEQARTRLRSLFRK